MLSSGGVARKRRLQQNAALGRFETLVRRASGSGAYNALNRNARTQLASTYGVNAQTGQQVLDQLGQARTGLNTVEGGINRSVSLQAGTTLGKGPNARKVTVGGAGTIAALGPVQEQLNQINIPTVPGPVGRTRRGRGGAVRTLSLLNGPTGATLQPGAGLFQQRDQLQTRVTRELNNANERQNYARSVAESNRPSSREARVANELVQRGLKRRRSGQSTARAAGLLGEDRRRIL